MLMSVLLLQLYETLISTAKGQRASSPKAHLKGALTLIKHQGVGGFEDEMSQGLLFNIEDCFRASVPMGKDIYAWKDVKPDSQLPPKETTTQEPYKNRIHLEVDDICASIPYHIGDRIKPGAIGDRRVQYPQLPGKKFSDAHYLTAPALGGFALLPMGTVLGMKIKLRDGQRE
ncbi:hypothetical protein B0J14DRAFT_632375 [Halenospora varia]|nr:hypothetical protein B0J14DRAFT_632375 [Halenospora varia]